jgi:two-component system, response regulator YesN
MFKVLLVDDEPWALRGIRESFKWEEENFKVIAETTRSLEAFDIIIEERPDVVFTDIRMPVISGIELMQKVRESGLDTEFIVISGFDEFSYAQQALRQGAFDYCLKPLEIDYAKSLLVKLSHHLHDKNSSKEIGIFEAIIEKDINIKEILESYGLGNSKDYYQAVVIIARDPGINNEILKMLAAMDNVEIRIGHNKFLYLINTSTDIKASIILNETSSNYIGISGLSDSPKDALKLYLEADIAAKGYFVYRECCVFSYKRKNIDVLNDFVKSFCTLFDEVKYQELKNLIRDIPDFFRKNELFMEDLIYFWNQIVAFVNRKFAKKSIEIGLEFLDHVQLVYQFKNIEAFTDSLLSQMTFLIEKTEVLQVTGDYANADFNKLISYIHEHIHEQLYLRDIAKIFFINPNYCCNLFKKLTNGTFSDYVNKLRIAKAKKLLTNYELTIEEIAQKVGYNDYYYFIKLFKKQLGVTPTKYRKEIFEIKG